MKFKTGMIQFRMAVVSVPLLFFSFHSVTPNIAPHGPKAVCHNTLDAKLNFVLGHTQALRDSPSDSTPNAVVLRLRGACGEPDPPTGKASAQARTQRSGASEMQPLRRHVEPGGNSTRSRVRVAKYQSRILFVGQLPYDVTKEQVPLPAPAPLLPICALPVTWHALSRQSGGSAGQALSQPPHRCPAAPRRPHTSARAT
jgi:hypothetical protein